MAGRDQVELSGLAEGPGEEDPAQVHDGGGDEHQGRPVMNLAHDQTGAVAALVSLPVGARPLGRRRIVDGTALRGSIIGGGSSSGSLRTPIPSRSGTETPVTGVSGRVAAGRTLVI